MSFQINEPEDVKYIKNPLLLLLLFWLIVQGYLLFNNGIYTGGESIRLIREANHFAEGSPFTSPIYWSYLTEILLLFLKIKLNTGFGWIIFIQLTVNLWATYTFFRFLRTYYNSEKLAVSGSIVLIACLPYQQYNTFVYTESLFFSLSILFSCFLLQTKTLTWSKAAFILIGIVILCFTRPTGIFFAFATVLYLFGLLKKMNGKLRWLSLASILVLILLLVNQLMQSGEAIDMITPLREGHVICDVPTALSVSDPAPSVDRSLGGLFIYIFQHKSMFLHLAVQKTKAFFGLTRSFYSTGHNIFITLYFYSLYLLIILGLILKRKRIPLSYVYCLSLILTFWMAVVLSCDEWHNRFFLTLTPFLIIAALAGFAVAAGDNQISNTDK